MESFISKEMKEDNEEGDYQYNDLCIKQSSPLDIKQVIV